MKVLTVVRDGRLTFHKHVSMVARSCNYHAQATRHIRHLLTTELAQTLACSLILSRIDYCNAVLHGAPTGTIQKLQRVENNAARIALQAPRRFLANRYCTSCIGCQSSSGSHTSWQFRHTKFGARPLRFTYIAESQNVPVQPKFTFSCDSAAGPTVHENRLL